MRRTEHVWAFGLSLAALVGLTTALVPPSPSVAQVVGAPGGDYWRHNNGRWDYWHAGDRRWYHTDGQHWYYHDGKAWHPYKFDRDFGRERFERGGYTVPGPNVNIVVPRHDVYIPR